MSNFEKFSDDFEKLILSREFKELSEEELRNLKAEGITEDEFNKIKGTLASLQSLEEDKIAPSSTIKSELMAAFDEPQKEEGRIIRWPFWITTGLSVAALLVLGLFVIKPNFMNVDSNTPVAQRVEESKKEGTDMNPIKLNKKKVKVIEDAVAESEPKKEVELSQRNDLQEEFRDGDMISIPAPQEHMTENSIQSELESLKLPVEANKEQVAKKAVNKDFEESVLDNEAPEDSYEINNMDSPVLLNDVVISSQPTSTQNLTNFSSGSNIQATSINTYKNVQVVLEKSVSLSENSEIFSELVTIY
jgi:hypothetical protein